MLIPTVKKRNFSLSLEFVRMDLSEIFIFPTACVFLLHFLPLENIPKVHLLEHPPITLINQGPKINSQQRKGLKNFAPFTPHHMEEEIASPTTTPTTYTNSRLELRQRKHRAMFRLSRTLKEKRGGFGIGITRI